MPLLSDQKFSTFQTGGGLNVGDIIVGLRAGINTQFTWSLPPGVTTISGTANEVLVNGTSGSPIQGAITLTLPQAIATTSSPTFSALTLTTALTVPNGGTGDQSFTAYSLIAGGTTSTGALQNISGVGTSGQVLVSNGAAALPTWQSVPGLVAAALTEVNDTNVTMTLGGTPATALLQAVSMTLGWTGQLSLARGGSNANLTASNGGIVYSTASAMAILAGTATANLPLLSGISSAPSWGAFALSLGGALTSAGALTLSGAFASTFTFTNTTSVTFPTSGTLATTSQLPTGAALTKTNDTNVTLTLGGTPATALLQATSLTLGWTGQLAIGRGGTGVSSVTIAPTASAWAGWDANNNLSANNFIPGFATTVSSASPIVLTVASAGFQYITGSTAQTVTMPVTSTLVAGMSWTIVNLSSATATIQSSGANAIVSLPASSQATVTCILNSGTTAASWSDDFSQSSAGVSAITGTANQVIASASTGAVTLSLPQSIATSSAVQFGSVKFSTNTGLLDSNGNSLLAVIAVASAVNSITISNNITGSPPYFIAQGSDTNIGLFLESKGNLGVQVKGTGTNDSANVGYVGELISSVIANASAVSLATTVAKDMTTISLTAGDWDIYGNVYISSSTGVLIDMECWCSLTSATVPDQSLRSIASYSLGNVANWGSNTPYLRVSIAATTTVYISAVATFSTGTTNMRGGIYARRVR